ncbi:MAG: hypothetical protein AB1634_06575 [Thermodesulfobacteriota bacterium]
MIREYSARPMATFRGVTVIGLRRGSGASHSGWLWQTTGIIVTGATALAVVASLWLGWQIRQGLAELGQLRQEQVTISERHRLLSAQRDALLSREAIEAKAAARLGLLPPTDQQRRTP